MKGVFYTKCSWPPGGMGLDNKGAEEKKKKKKAKEFYHKHGFQSNCLEVSFIKFQVPLHSLLNTHTSTSMQALEQVRQSCNLRTERASEIICIQLLLLPNTQNTHLYLRTLRFQEKNLSQGPIPIKQQIWTWMQAAPQQTPALPLVAKGTPYWNHCLWPECSPRKPHKPLLLRGRSLIQQHQHQLGTCLKC